MLLIMRHAKSSWDNPAQTDHERPLNARGLRDAPRMGELLAANGLVPDLIISSTATRARETAEIMSQSSGYENEITFTDDLYLASPSAIVGVLSQLAGDAERVMIVPHNPGLEELVYSLTGEHERMPTAAIAVANNPVGWSELTVETRCELVQMWRPKEL